MTCGVYKIVNKINGKFYIGSSSNIEKRFYHHIINLKKSEHHCQHLLNSFKKHGEQAFELIILEECAPEDKLKIEQIYIDAHYDNNMCYNTNKNACGMDSDKATQINNKRFSLPENRVKLSESLKRAWADPNNSMRERLSKQYTNPDFKQKQREHFRNLWKDPEYRELITKHSVVNAKKQWDTMRDKMVTSLNSPETLAKQSASAKRNWEDPEFREKMMNRPRPTEEIKKILSNIGKLRSSDPNFSRQQMLRCPHREEIVCIETGEKHPSISELSRYLKLNCSRALRKAMKANRKFKGMTYKYLKDLQ